MMHKIQVLESELAVWKERNSEWEKLHKEKYSITRLDAGVVRSSETPIFYPWLVFQVFTGC